MLEPSGLVIGLLLATLAGLSTGFGGLAVVVLGRPSPTVLSFALGLSAGVLVLISFVELLNGAIETLGFTTAIIPFFVGIGSIFAVDALFPHDYLEEHQVGSAYLHRLGLLSALGIAIHNFPEGLAVLAGAISSPSLGVLLAVAIGIHNIPEGVVVALPIFAGTGDRTRAFLYSLVAGAAEPLGAAIAALVLSPIVVTGTLPYLLAFVAGVMVFISLDELLPAAHRYAHEHIVILGVVTGLAIMSLALRLLQS